MILEEGKKKAGMEPAKNTRYGVSAWTPNKEPGLEAFKHRSRLKQGRPRLSFGVRPNGQYGVRSRLRGATSVSNIVGELMNLRGNKVFQPVTRVRYDFKVNRGEILEPQNSIYFATNAIASHAV